MTDESNGGPRNEQDAASKVTFDEERIENLAQGKLGIDDDGTSTTSDGYHHYHSPLARTVSSFRGRGHRRGAGTSGASASSTSAHDDTFEHDDRLEFASSGSVEIPVTLTIDEGDDIQNNTTTCSTTLSVDSTSVAMRWTVPPKRGARWSASFASRSISRRKLGYLTCTSRVGYDLLPSTQLYTELDFGPHSHATVGTYYRLSRTSAIQVGVGSVPYTASGAMAISVQGRRNFLKDRIGGTMTLGMDTRRRFHVLQLGLRTLVDRIPVISLNVNIGVNSSPFEVAVENQRGLVSVGIGGTGNMVLNGMVRRSLSNFAALGVGVRAAGRRGVSWLFQLERGDFVMTIPVMVCTSFDGSSAIVMMYLTFLSGLIDGIIGDFIGATNAKYLTTNGEDDNANDGSRTMLNTESLLSLDKVREDAERQTSLMQRQATSKRKHEEVKKGLVIEQAVYYVEGAGGGKLDVSVQLQFWVKDSSLHLPSTSKSNLLGFYDVRGTQQKNDNAVSSLSWKSVWRRFWSEPDVAMPKLYVRYMFEGDEFEVSILDDEELILPSPSAVRVKVIPQERK